jgi:ubiquinone biosynthesis protein Coq4
MTTKWMRADGHIADLIADAKRRLTVVVQSNVTCIVLLNDITQNHFGLSNLVIKMSTEIHIGQCLKKNSRDCSQ